MQLRRWHPTTPRIDKPAEGMHLLNFHVEAQCTPSRSAFLTGRFSIMLTDNLGYGELSAPDFETRAFTLASRDRAALSAIWTYDRRQRV
jgi:arylsulfatase A-like enzyme